MPYSFHKASTHFASDGEIDFDGSERIFVQDGDTKKYFYHRASDRFYSAKPIPGSKNEVILHGIIYKGDNGDLFSYCDLKFEFKSDEAFDFVSDLRIYYGYSKKP